MKNTWKWIIGIAVVLVVLFALSTLLGSFFGYGYGGMTLAPGASAGVGGGYGDWRHPMMSGYSYSPFGGLFMGFGMLLAWGIPLALLGLVVYGAVRLANKPGSPVTTQSCTNCGKPAQTDWKNCPYCGTEL